MKLSELNKPEGSTHSRKRVGRGKGSGHGGTSGRGHKGQKARSGTNKRPVWFEGGQMPIQRRLPKRGFTNIFRKTYQIVNLSDLERLGQQEKIGPEEMARRGLIRSALQPVKVLGDGQLTFAASIAAHAFSAKARSAIEAAGGKVEEL
ncbi:MAG: 50S ribosomal protein L15 [Candidatus Glassbacteria bacterium RIFCSPLOWO2_12_FULL_58_11]|uniref:Large ribosomal subunit protein uL15 n=1 Tax=Candidatus Glassbacteria bacterium RIFCSPLOWO2_12_FULL_58_11 TaxID=1817867 RepID=A0A1F5YP73_9BACT|nr:ribosomal protein L15 [uncultured bacterium]OGG01989.1 MAG: 50S ribosomal protein L15 [Candidatus Glassbacteria bacterium RIFCSPLOWO2_12_FULL_58_11]